MGHDGYFRVAFAFKCDPWEVAAWPQRKYLQALQWLEDQWNRPDRHDYYLMQLAIAVLNIPPRLFGGKFVSSFSSVKLEWGEKLPTSQEELERRAKWVEAAWCARLGINPVTHESTVRGVQGQYRTGLKKG